jgi:outer membrane receptor protein involved in Fe transport
LSKFEFKTKKNWFSKFSMMLIGSKINTLIFKLYLILFALIGSGELARGQIKGKVVDSSDSVLPYATVSILLPKGQLAITSCDSVGNFVFNNLTILNGLSIRASFLGDSSKLEPITDTLRFYTLTIIEKQLDEIVVKGSKPKIEKKADRTIYNIGSNPLFSNRSIVDILKSIPRVLVEKNEIKIRGKGTVLVMINDRLLYLNGKDLLDYLKVFQNDISSIEVIPNPSAKYDAEGSGGMINIVLKNGNATGLAGDVETIAIKNSYSQSLNSANLRFRNKNFSVTTSIGYSKGAYKETLNEVYLFKNSAETSWDNQASNKNEFSTIRGSANIEYLIGKKSKVTASYGLIKNESGTTKLETIKYFNNSPIYDSLGQTQGLENISGTTNSLGLSFDSQLIPKKISMSATLDWVKRTNMDDSKSSTIILLSNDNPSGVVQGISSFGDSPKDILSTKLDFSYSNLLLSSNLDFGIKYNQFNNSSKIVYDQTVNEKSIFEGTGIITNNDFIYNEKNTAAYFVFDNDFKKWSSKFGLRYEGTFTDGLSRADNKQYVNEYHNFFPSLFIQYKFNEATSIDISYSKRINRPKIWDINPYRWYSNFYSYSIGNPFLRPSLQDNFEINVAIENAIYVNLYYNSERNPVLSLPFSVGNNTIENRKINNGEVRNYGINLDGDFSFALWMNNSISVGIGSYDFITDYSYTLTRRKIIVDINSTNLFQISKTFSGSLGLKATLPGGGYDILTQNGSYRFDIGLNKLFFKKQFELTLNIDDVFKSSSPFYNAETDAFKNSSYEYYDFRAITIGFKYRFGKEFRTAKRKNIIREEQNRIGS